MGIDYCIKVNITQEWMSDVRMSDLVLGIKIGSGNGLALSGNMPWPRPMLTLIYDAIIPGSISISLAWWRWRHHKGKTQKQVTVFSRFIYNISHMLLWYINQHCKSFYGSHFRSIVLAPYLLTHWGRDKMAAISQTTFSNGFSWMKTYKLWLRFH